MTKGKTKFFLEFNLPYVILTGQSGIGKTTLINALNSPSSVIESPLIFIPFAEKHPRESWEVYFRRYTGEYIGYADEDFTLATTREFQENAVKYKANMLLVMRTGFGHLPIGVGDVYTFKCDDGFTHELVPYLKMYPVPRVEGNKYSCVVTEDSKSGYIFFSKYLRNVESAGGKSNVLKGCEHNLNTVFIVDSLGFGAQLPSAIEALRDNYSSTLFLIDSFEEMVLHSDLFHSDKYCRVEEYNKEDWYTRALSEHMNLLGKSYSKGKPNGCILNDCCTCPPKCEYYTRGNKFNLILGRYLQEMQALSLDMRDQQESECSSPDKLVTEPSSKDSIRKTNLFG